MNPEFGKAIARPDTAAHQHAGEPKAPALTITRSAPSSEHLRGRLGLAIGVKTYEAYRRLMDSDRWQRLANAGARVQRLLWASTGTKDPDSPDTMYIDGLRAPQTITTIPEATLRAFEHHGQVGAPIAADGGDANATLAQFESAGIDVDALATTLQSDGDRNFVKSWQDLLSRIDDQVAAVTA